MAIFRNYDLKRILSNMDSRIKLKISRYRENTDDSIRFIQFYMYGDIVGGGLANNLIKIHKILRRLKWLLNITHDKNNGESFPYIIELLDAVTLEKEFETVSMEEYLKIRNKINNYFEDLIIKNDFLFDPNEKTKEKFWIYTERISKKELTIDISEELKKEFLEDFLEKGENLKKIKEDILSFYKEMIIKKASEFERIIEQREPLLIFKVGEAFRMKIFLDAADLFKDTPYYGNSNNDFFIKFKVELELLTESHNKKLIDIFLEDFQENLNKSLVARYGDIVQYLPYYNEDIQKGISRAQNSLYMLYRLLNKKDELSHKLIKIDPSSK